MAAVAVDIDVLCVWMCFVQCHFYGIPAKIIHGDSLKLEISYGLADGAFGCVEDLKTI